MDEIVKQGMAKWPNVPAVYGWLGLDRRGHWLIKGGRIANAIVADFIGRNYEHDDQGRWFFQNGPQRVFISLGYTPYVYRMASDPAAGAAYRMQTHTGRAATRIEGAWIDDAGIVLIATEHGIGVIDDRDLERLLPCFTDAASETLPEDAIGTAVERLQAGEGAALHLRYGQYIVPVSAIAAADVPARFGFVQHPVQPAGEEECY
jgi:hypothetical protein